MNIRIYLGGFALFLGLLYLVLGVALNGLGPLQGLQAELKVLTSLQREGVLVQGTVTNASTVKSFSSQSNNRPSTSYHYHYTSQGMQYQNIEIIPDDLLGVEFRTRSLPAPSELLVSRDNPYTFRLAEAIALRISHQALGTRYLRFARSAVGIAALALGLLLVALFFLRKPLGSRNPEK